MTRRIQNILFAILLSAVAMSPALAAEVSDEELAAMRAAIEALNSRLDRLEQANAELKAENARLAQGNAELRESTEQAVAAVESVAESREASSWTERMRWEGDFRARYEHIDEEGKDNRDRYRIRARAALIADISDTMEVGLGLASGGDDPVSTNQTLGGGGSTKDINLDLAYFSWSGLENTEITGGKFKNPLYQPSKDQLLWDDDWRPEGTALEYDNGSWFVNLLGTFLESDSNRGTEFAGGAQAGVYLGLGDSAELTAGAGYFDIGVAGRTPLFDDEFFGNSFDPVTGTYLYNYEMLQAFASLDFQAFGMPATAFANWVNNQDAPAFDTAYSLGFGLGEAKAPGTWEVGYLYKDVEADAVFGLLTDSDFGGGGTDAKGHVVSATYAIHSAWNAKFTYFINEIDADTGSEHDYNRLQLDLNFKYK